MADQDKIHALDLMEMEIAMTTRENRCMFEIEDFPGNIRYCGRGKGHPGAHACGAIRAGTFCMWSRVPDCVGDIIKPPPGMKCPECGVELTDKNTREQFLGMDEDGVFDTRHICSTCQPDDDD